MDTTSPAVNIGLTGVNYILTEVIGFKEDAPLIADVISSYSMPSKWSDISSWCTYVVSNIGHVARRVFHPVVPSYIDKSEWSKLEDRTFSHFYSATSSLSSNILGMHWSELPSSLFRETTREDLTNEFNKKFMIGLAAIAWWHTIQSLATCREAQAKGMTYEYAKQMAATHSYSAISRADFLENIKNYRLKFLAECHSTFS